MKKLLLFLLCVSSLKAMDSQPGRAEGMDIAATPRPTKPYRRCDLQDCCHCLKSAGSCCCGLLSLGGAISSMAAGDRAFTFIFGGMFVAVGQLTGVFLDEWHEYDQAKRKAAGKLEKPRTTPTTRTMPTTSDFVLASLPGVAGVISGAHLAYTGADSEVDRTIRSAASVGFMGLSVGGLWGLYERQRLLKENKDKQE